MATKYEKQIEKLLAYVKRLNQLVEERTQQLQYWQGYAHKLREERERLSGSMLGAAKRILQEVAERQAQLKSENQKLKAHIHHQTELHQKATFQLKNQLTYALSRIDDLSLERKQWRQSMQSKQQAVWQAMGAKEVAEKRLSEELQVLQQQLERERQQTQALTARLETAEQQISIQQMQWQDLLGEKTALERRLEQTEHALAIAQKTLSESLASQQSSMGREVDSLRALVVSLQRQTETLHAEIANNQDTIEKQERFITLLKQDKSPNIRSLSDRRKDTTEDSASG